MYTTEICLNLIAPNSVQPVCCKSHHPGDHTSYAAETRLIQFIDFEAEEQISFLPVHVVQKGPENFNIFSSLQYIDLPTIYQTANNFLLFKLIFPDIFYYHLLSNIALIDHPS